MTIEVTDDDRRKHDRGTQLVLPHVGAAYVLATSQPGSAEDKRIQHGTVGFIDTGESGFVVTANHVFEEFEKYRNEYPGASLYIAHHKGGMVLRREGVDFEVIDRNERVDVATLQLSAELETKMGPMSYFPQTDFVAWPSERPKPGDPAIVVGFPGQDSQAVSSTKRRRGASSWVVSVGEVNEREFSLDLDVDEFVSVNGRSLDDFDPGGMSGSPVFSWTKPFRILGVVVEGRTSLRRLLVTHADFIKADGSIDDSMLS